MGQSSKEAQLHRAAWTGGLQLVCELLAQGADPNTRDSDECTALHIAAGTGHADVARALLEGGAKPDVKGLDAGFTPLHFAVLKGHREVVEVLLLMGADANAVDNKGVTPLWNAAQDGHKEIVELLLAHGAHADGGSVAGRAPLHMAARQGHRQIVELLLQHGADPVRQDKLGMTPLDMALFNGDANITELLRKHGASGEHPMARMAALAGGLTQTEQHLSEDGAQMRNLDLLAMADELKRDSDKLSKLGVTLAKGAWAVKVGGIGTGIAVGWRINPLLGAAVAGAGFLAKGIFKGWKQIKIDQVRQKWYRMLTSMSEDQLHEFALTVKQRYPLLMDGLAMMLSPAGGPAGYLE